MSEITQQQAAALATILSMIRPDDWKPKQILELAYQHRAAHTFPELVEAAVRAARNPELRSPAAIFLPGRHWNHDQPATTTPPAPACEDHREEAAHNCRCCCCWADVRCGDRPETRIGKHWNGATP